MRVCISARIISFPRRCACCMGASEIERPARMSKSRGKRVVRTETRTWNIPYCLSCSGHASTWETGTTLGWIVFAVAAVVTVAAMFNGSSRESQATLIVGSIVSVSAGVGTAIFFKGMATLTKKSSCALAGPAVHFVGWDGSVQVFDIAPKRYALEVMAANATKLVNVSNIQAQMLAEFASARKAEPIRETNAQDDSGAVVMKWVAKIESAKGPASRRTALQAALADVPSDTLKDRLRLEASRIEVQAALDKVDSLKSVAAKRRTLEAAIEHVRNDGVPDELQAEQIRWLEEALAELTDKSESA